MSVIGQQIGDAINGAYRSSLERSDLSRHQVAEVLVDLKRRIQGDFCVIEDSDEKIVLARELNTIELEKELSIYGH